jgi:hypothetical protein
VLRDRRSAARGLSPRPFLFFLKIYKIGAQIDAGTHRQRFSLRGTMQAMLFDWLIGDTPIFGVGVQHWMLIVVFVVFMSFVLSKLCEQRVRG